MDSSGWYVDNLSTPYNEVNYNGHLVAKGFISMDSPNHKMSTMYLGCTEVSFFIP